ncbi:MAG: hypothetical protein KAI02_00125 [Gammaproteobacteria bacterium]|nr:hypothetical protein [Gammaproteobacteria bacterium]
MPFTPIHLGPGLLIKAVLQGSFSLMVFAWSQIIMDIQPLIVMLSGIGHLHGFSHTYLGATLLALLSALSGRSLSLFGLKIMGLANKGTQITWTVAFISAFIGTYSHVILDAIMHSDVEPYFPLTLNNHLLGLVSIEQLHQWCLYSGLIGIIIYYSVYYFFQKKDKKY